MDRAKNKNSAIEFYRIAFNGDPQRAIDLFAGKEYIQHNPDVRDGHSGFIEYFERMHREYPDKSIKFLRCISEVDFVALHIHQTWPGDDQYFTMDFFRFDSSGKIVEHWDSIQSVPKSSKNSNTMF